MRQPSPSKSVFFRYLSVVVFEPHGVYSDFLCPAHISFEVVYKQTLLGFQPVFIEDIFVYPPVGLYDMQIARDYHAVEKVHIVKARKIFIEAPARV